MIIHSSRRFLVFILFAGITIGLGFPGLLHAEGERLQRLDRLFERTSGWTGGDGVSSIPLAADRILWLFGDSWVGRIQNNSRRDAKMVNNAVALQTVNGKRLSRPHYFWGNMDRAEPKAFFVPPDHRGWFWPLHGHVTAQGLFVFLLQLDKTSDESVFGFKNIGLWLVRIPNYQAPIDQWRPMYRKIPWCRFFNDRNIFWGSSVVRFEKTYYLYGVDEEPEKPGAPKNLIVARIPGEDFSSFGDWRFWNGAEWSGDFRKVAPLLTDVATEFSVTSPDEKSLALITMEKNLSRRILFSTSPRPEGPWEKPTAVYTIEEERALPNVFCYAAKAHPELAKNPREFIISFVANSFDFWEIARNARLYWPKFLRLSLPGLQDRKNE